MNSKHSPKNVIDQYGNLWLSDKPCRSNMTAEEFNTRLAGYPTIVVHTKTDEVFAAGQNEQSLEKSFVDLGINPTSFQLEPGPLNNLDLSFAKS